MSYYLHLLPSPHSRVYHLQLAEDGISSLLHIFQKKLQPSFEIFFSKLSPSQIGFSKLWKVSKIIHDKSRRGCYLFIDETLGIVSTLQMPSLSNLSLISQANIDGHSVLYLQYWLSKVVSITYKSIRISPFNSVDNRVGGHSGFWPAYSFGSDGSCFIVPGQCYVFQHIFYFIEYLPSKYFWNTSIRDLKYSGNITRPGSTMSQFHNLLSCGIWEWSTWI